MLDIQESINSKYIEIETKMNQLVEKVKELNTGTKVTNCFSKNKMDKEDIKIEWYIFEGGLMTKVKNLLEDVQDNEKSQNWYPIVERIQEKAKEMLKKLEEGFSRNIIDNIDALSVRRSHLLKHLQFI